MSEQTPDLQQQLDATRAHCLFVTRLLVVLIARCGRGQVAIRAAERKKMELGEIDFVETEKGDIALFLTRQKVSPAVQEEPKLTLVTPGGNA